jgi:hypothetical protein
MYDNETSQAAKFREILTDYGIVTMATKVDGTEFTTDGDMQYNRLCFLIIEVKLEIGSKGAEPLFQAIWYYVEAMRHSLGSTGSALPCLIIYLFGSSGELGACDSC